MKYSIIIPAKNEEKLLPFTLESIKATKFDGEVEVIVIDGGSTDKTVEIAKKYGIKVINETGKNKSPPNAKNIGVKNSKGDVIITLYADVSLDPQFFKDLAKTRGKWDALYCKEISMQDSFIEKLFSLRTFSTGYSNFPLVFKRYVFDKIMWDATLTYGEEREFCRKLKERFDVKRTEATVKCHNPHTMGELFAQLRWYGRTSLFYFKKYKEPKTFSMMAFLLLPLVFLGIPFALFSFPVWLYEIYTIFRLLLKYKDPIIFLAPVFDFLRGCFFAFGILESLFGRTHGGR